MFCNNPKEEYMKKFISACVGGSLFLLCGCAHVENSTEKELSMAQEYIELIKDWKNPEELAEMSSLNWKSESECKIVYSSKDFASFKIFSYSYSGGAHGMPDTKVGTVRNGRILTLADLPENIRLLWEKALKSHPCFTSIKKYCDFTKEKPQMTENFYLDDKGVHFIYQPYEIAPFAIGTIDIFVPCKL
jgi:hypothetical protein